MSNEDLVQRVLSAQNALTKLENKESLNQEDLQALTWAVLEVSVQVLLCPEKLSPEEIAYGKELGKMLDK